MGTFITLKRGNYMVRRHMNKESYISFNSGCCKERRKSNKIYEYYLEVKDNINIYCRNVQIRACKIPIWSIDDETNNEYLDEIMDLCKQNSEKRVFDLSG